MFNPESYEDFTSGLKNIIGQKYPIDLVALRGKIQKKYSWEKSAKILHEEVIIN